MAYTVKLNHRDLYWIIKKLKAYYHLATVREVVRFLSKKTETGEKKQ